MESEKAFSAKISLSEIIEQNIKKDSKRRRKEQGNFKTENDNTARPYLSIIILNVNRLNSLIKRPRVAE